MRNQRQISFWMEIELARVGDVEVQVSAMTDDEDVQIESVSLNGQEISDQLSDNTYKIIEEKASDEAYSSAAEHRMEMADMAREAAADHAYEVWKERRDEEENNRK